MYVCVLFLRYFLMGEQKQAQAGLSISVCCQWRGKEERMSAHEGKSHAVMLLRSSAPPSIYPSIHPCIIPRQPTVRVQSAANPSPPPPLFFF